LHNAARWNHLPAAKALINAGAGVMAKDIDERTPLSFASRWNHTDVAKTLLRAGADVAWKDCFGYAPLDTAVNFGNAGVVQALLEAGADASTTYGDGMTALHHAARLNHTDVAQVLLDAGADASVLRRRPIGLRSSNVEMVELFERVANEREELRFLAFAMGHHERLGQESLVQTLEEGVVRMVLQQRGARSRLRARFTPGLPV